MIEIKDLQFQYGAGDFCLDFPHLQVADGECVAVCRALLVKPHLLLADEPTGNLDVMNKDRVLDILLDYAKDNGATLVTVMHDRELFERFERIVDFKQFYGDTNDSTAVSRKERDK